MADKPKTRLTRKNKALEKPSEEVQSSPPALPPVYLVGGITLEVGNTKYHIGTQTYGSQVPLNQAELNTLMKLFELQSITSKIQAIPVVEGNILDTRADIYID